MTDDCEAAPEQARRRAALPALAENQQLRADLATAIAERDAAQVAIAWLVGLVAESDAAVRSALAERDAS